MGVRAIFVNRPAPLLAREQALRSSNADLCIRGPLIGFSMRLRSIQASPRLVFFPSLPSPRDPATEEIDGFGATR